MEADVGVVAVPDPRKVRRTQERGCCSLPGASDNKVLSSFCLGFEMPIVTITESLPQCNRAAGERILRDRVLYGFCVRLNARKHTFRVITSVRGKPFKMTLGYWPLMSVDEARARAMEVLRLCRRGEVPPKLIAPALPTLREAYLAYCVAKKIKASVLIYSFSTDRKASARTKPAERGEFAPRLIPIRPDTRSFA